MTPLLVLLCISFSFQKKSFTKGKVMLLRASCSAAGSVWDTFRGRGRLGQGCSLFVTFMTRMCQCSRGAHRVSSVTSGLRLCFVQMMWSCWITVSNWIRSEEMVLTWRKVNSPPWVGSKVLLQVEKLKYFRVLLMSEGRMEHGINKQLVLLLRYKVHCGDSLW